MVYFGGVNLFQVELQFGTSSIASYTVDEDNTTFLTLINFGADYYDGRLEVGAFADASVEIRFGSGKTQKAHRFLVPEGATSGVPDGNYAYTDYVDVPFEVWDVTNNQQLMVSFRDQDRNGQFNLRLSSTEGDALTQSREYLFINKVPYATNPNASIAVAGGQKHNEMYFFWPVLAAGNTWPGGITESTLRLLLTSIPKRNANTLTVSDAYGQFDSKNRFINYGTDLHPDQHNLIMIPMSGNTYKILNANDGGVFISNTSSTPGINNGDWSMRGRTYNTSQFYGADKRPGFDEYIGGMQDNGTWKSPSSQTASSTTDYFFNIGGDGFEVIWNNLDDQKVIGGSQGNNFRRSTNGGVTWSNATSGLSGNHPFVSKLANSRDNPDRIYTLSSAGVFHSSNFGESWTLTPITEKWGSSTSLMDIEVSRANADIVWAGSGMNATRSIHVSTNAGISFSATNNSPLISGGITKLASHPSEPNTAYVLFSQAGNPKILRTEDLGHNWEDISGFGNGDISANGFPDVAVYCLYVRPDNPNIIWAGTEIGIVESLDNGQSWSLIEDFPSVSVWDMKGQDDQVVIATHGRGIWTATIESSQINVNVPEILASGTSPKEKLMLKVKSTEYFDKIDFYDANTFLGTITNIEPSEIIVEIGNLNPGTKNIKLISYIGSSPYHSKTYTLSHLDILSVEDTYGSYFNSSADLTLSGFSLFNMAGSSAGERSRAQSSHPYGANQNNILLFRHPIRVAGSEAVILYEDIALVEPGLEGAAFGTADFKDFVVVEGSKNGLDWMPLAEGYDARKNPEWLNAFNSATPGSKSLFREHAIDMAETFSVGDTLLIRYRLSTNATVSGWGCVVNFFLIQQEPTGLEQKPDKSNNFAIFPNPANDITNLTFTLSRPGPVTVHISDLSGRSVKQSEFGIIDAGEHTLKLNVKELAAGNHLIQLKTIEGDYTGRLVIIK